jgi:hypothetical protein
MEVVLAFDASDAEVLKGRETVVMESKGGRGNEC